MESFDKDTFQMMRDFKFQANERACEIEVISLFEFEAEKDKIIKQEQTKIKEEYDKKITKLETDHKIAKSNKLNQQKLRRINDRSKYIETTVADALKELYNKHCLPTNAAYKELLKKLLLQTMIKMQETYLKIQVRKMDYGTVQGVISEAISEFKELMLKEAKKTVNVEIMIDLENYLPEACCGGIIVTNKDSKICCSNALDFRMKVCFEEALPMIRQKMLGTPDKVKLTYFPFPARGEQIRMLLRYAKVPFEDERIPMEKWPAEKMSGKYEYQQLPVLEFNGKIYSQTPAIMFFLADKYGFLPSDPILSYEVLNVAYAATDLFEAYAKWAFSRDPVNKETMRKDYYLRLVPFMFKKLEERLSRQKGKSVMVGDRITYCDFTLAGFARTTFMAPSEESDYEPIYKDCPLLKAYFKELMKLQ